MASGVHVEWRHPFQEEYSDPALFVFTSVDTGDETQHYVKPNTSYCISLSAGLYRVAIFAKDLKNYKGALDLKPGVATKLSPMLEHADSPPKNLQTVLAKFDIKRFEHDRRDLTIKERQTLVLDIDDRKFSGAWSSVEIKDVAAAKRIIGHPDEMWGINHTRFKLADVSDQDDPELMARHFAREYVYGNSAKVDHWKDQINRFVFDETWKFPLFVFGTVTINAGGVLVIGDKGNFFVCEKLRMHVTSTLVIRGSGPIHVEPISIETFC